MAPSFDCVASSLLCAEDNSFFDNNEYGGLVEEFEEATWYDRNHRFHGNENRSIDVEEFPLLSDECLSVMVEKETQYLPFDGYLKRLQNGDLDIVARMGAVDWISKVCAHFSFGPLCAYLAINYMDRFLSTYDLPKSKAWTMQLLAVACLSIAAKLEETEMPLSLDLQVCESKFVFEAKTIQRMELLILSTLRWRMQAVTPFSYIDYYLRKIHDDEISLRVSIVRSIQLILTTIQGIDFLEFKPSEIAAAVAISVAAETQAVETENAIPALIHHVQKERVVKCIKLVHSLSLICGTFKTTRAVVSVPQSPSGVLDVECLSYKSDDTTVGSCANSSHHSPQAKRRRLSTPYYEVEL